MWNEKIHQHKCKECGQDYACMNDHTIIPPSPLCLDCEMKTGYIPDYRSDLQRHLDEVAI